jgi:hypothetical protein
VSSISKFPPRRPGSTVVNAQDGAWVEFCQSIPAVESYPDLFPVEVWSGSEFIVVYFNRTQLFTLAAAAQQTASSTN